MGEFVVEDQVFGTEEVAKHRGVGTVAAGKHHGPLGADELCQFGVEGVEHGVVAADHPARRGAAAEAVDGLLRGPLHVRVPGEPEVIEAGEGDGLAAAHGGDAALHPFVGEEKRVFETGMLQPRQSLLERLALRPGRIGRCGGDGMVGRWQRLSSSGGRRPISGIEHVGGDALDHVATATHARQPRRMKPHLVVAFQAADGIEKPLGVDPGVGDHRVCGEPPRRTRGTDLLEGREHDPRDGRSAGGVGHLPNGTPMGPGRKGGGAETRTNLLQEFGCHDVALCGSL